MCAQRLALFTAGLVLLISCSASGPSDPSVPHVFFITIDTLRADHLGTYGYGGDTSPQIDAFASKATVFETALSQAPNTIPSILQIMTSRYGLPHKIHENQTSLADVMRASGYETVAIVDNPLFEFDQDAHGLTKGFDRFFRNPLLDGEVLEQQLYKSNTPADVITAQANRLLNARANEKPLFMWLHYFDPHDPYAAPFAESEAGAHHRSSKSQFTGDIRRENFVKGGAPRPSADDIEHIVNLYDDEIRYVDASLGEFFARLKRDGLYDESLIILSSDHGESFGEHGVWMHGRSLYDSEIHIPLIVKLPHQSEGRRVSLPVQAIDIAPSIVDVLSLETSTHFDGMSVFGESTEPAIVVWLKNKVVRTKQWKLYETANEMMLFRIDVDPGETNNVASGHAAVIEELRAARNARLERVKQDAAEIRRLSTEAAEQMRVLGYIE
jgi:arylsulfatase A-like enzyme